MKHSFTSAILFVSVIALVILMAFRPQQDTFDKITVREFELIDDKGKQRASIKVEDDGEVILRLKDKNGTIRVKLGAGENGSGLVLLDNETNPGIHALAHKDEVSLKVYERNKK